MQSREDGFLWVGRDHKYKYCASAGAAPAAGGIPAPTPAAAAHVAARTLPSQVRTPPPCELLRNQGSAPPPCIGPTLVQLPNCRPLPRPPRRRAVAVP